MSEIRWIWRRLISMRLRKWSRLIQSLRSLHGSSYIFRGRVAVKSRGSVTSVQRQNRTRWWCRGRWPSRWNGWSASHRVTWSMTVYSAFLWSNLITAGAYERAVGCTDCQPVVHSFALERHRRHWNEIMPTSITWLYWAIVTSPMAPIGSRRIVVLFMICC